MTQEYIDFQKMLQDEFPKLHKTMCPETYDGLGVYNMLQAIAAFMFIEKNYREGGKERLRELENSTIV